MTTLPVDNYLPERAVEEGFDKMNYAVTLTEGEARYPAWQFVDPAPKLIPEVMKIFLAKPEFQPEMHRFFVTLLDELNELSPAEVLTGKVFPGNEIHQAQQRILDMDEDERLRRVVDAAQTFVNPCA